MAGKKPAYVIAEVEITDAAVFQEYVAKAVPTLAASNARIIARTNLFRRKVPRRSGKSLSSLSRVWRTRNAGTARRPIAIPFPYVNDRPIRACSSSRANHSKSERRC